MSDRKDSSRKFFKDGYTPTKQPTRTQQNNSNRGHQPEKSILSPKAPPKRK
mgnify:CR=1 FL=1